MTNSLRILILILTLAQFMSCEYKFVEIDEPDIDIKIKFSENILPIFSDHKCTACHHSNFTRIDFTPEKAYNTIVPNLIDTIQPELSKFYVYPSPTTAQHQFKKYTPVEAALILNWITQGAENN